MDLSPYQFDLPEELIALRPVSPRDAARLLVVHGDGRLEDRQVLDLPGILGSDYVMVFNDTRVIPAALKGVRPARDENGNDVELDANLVEALEVPGHWQALIRPGRRLRPGDPIRFDGGLTAEVVEKHVDGSFILSFSETGSALDEKLDEVGAMPLPPYIARRRAADRQDRTDYQTRFASNDAGSVAAPTAGLHFTDRLLENLKASRTDREFVRLHVGLGTFMPLTDKHMEEGRLHEEWRSISPEVAGKLNAAREAGKKILPVGTTAMRTLESAATGQGIVQAVSGPTDIFIRPGDPIHATDALMTNFHLPGSSLFMLVSALMGTDIMQAAYAHAIAEKYRFYSYGDACLLLP